MISRSVYDFLLRAIRNHVKSDRKLAVSFLDVQPSVSDEAFGEIMYDLFHLPGNEVKRPPAAIVLEPEEEEDDEEEEKEEGTESDASDSEVEQVHRKKRGKYNVISKEERNKIDNFIIDIFKKDPKLILKKTDFAEHVLIHCNITSKKLNERLTALVKRQRIRQTEDGFMMGVDFEALGKK